MAEVTVELKQQEVAVVVCCSKMYRACISWFEYRQSFVSVNARVVVQRPALFVQGACRGSKWASISLVDSGSIRQTVRFRRLEWNELFQRSPRLGCWSTNGVVRKSAV